MTDKKQKAFCSECEQIMPLANFIEKNMNKQIESPISQSLFVVQHTYFDTSVLHSLYGVNAATFLFKRFGIFAAAF